MQGLDIGEEILTHFIAPLLSSRVSIYAVLSISDYIASHVRTVRENSELEIVWKEVVMVQVLPAETEEYHEKLRITYVSAEIRSIHLSNAVL
jgi:hypothetical protein